MCVTNGPGMCYLQAAGYVCVFVAVHIDMCQNPGAPCISACDGLEDGDYNLCGDCQKYAVCSAGHITRNECDNGTDWGFNIATKKCQYKSPTCIRCAGRNQHACEKSIHRSRLALCKI